MNERKHNNVKKKKKNVHFNKEDCLEKIIASVAALRCRSLALELFSHMILKYNNKAATMMGAVNQQNAKQHSV